MKRKGYGNTNDESTKINTASNKKDTNVSSDSAPHKAYRTTSAPASTKTKTFTEPTSEPSGSQTAPVAVSTPFYQRKGTPDGKTDVDHHSLSHGSGQSGAAANSTRNSIKEESQVFKVLSVTHIQHVLHSFSESSSFFVNLNA